MGVPQTLLGLVDRYSPSGQERAAVEFLVRRMAKLGYTEHFIDQAGNAVGVLGSGPRQLVLLGHIDTVPGEIPVRIEGDLLFGRGTVDAKGPLAAFVDAAAAMDDLAGWQIVVIGAVDEERDSAGARFIAGRYAPKFAIIGEPSGWNRLTLGYKGVAWAIVRAEVSQGHAAGPDHSPAEMVFACWSRLREEVEVRNQGQKGEFQKIRPGLEALRSGEDEFHRWAEIEISTRLPLRTDPEAWYRLLEELVQPPLTVKQLGNPVPAYRAEKQNPLVRAFTGAIRSVGGKPGFLLKTGTADLNIVAPHWGCPALAYGPGDSSLDHTPEEHISLQEYRKAQSVLRGVLNRLTDYSE